jgi:hypothetical protein
LVYTLGESLEKDSKGLMKSKVLDELSIYELKSEGINFDRTMKGLVGDLVSTVRAAKGSGVGFSSVVMRKDEEI